MNTATVDTKETHSLDYTITHCKTVLNQLKDATCVNTTGVCITNKKCESWFVNKVFLMEFRYKNIRNLANTYQRVNILKTKTQKQKRNETNQKKTKDNNNKCQDVFTKGANYFVYLWFLRKE